ncbi:hypothetical protein DPMN_153047 [Dreissena polymorpha]|uniref:Uncharacterized protein n=1 Tax=Dreissena polymorpha TaxID=45954 RepID=A0A9D4FKR5_DREPO|nr:hypothetical protein DPMN_153047 [Dreissena polymorpha]
MFHDEWIANVISILSKWFYYCQIRKNCPVSSQHNLSQLTIRTHVQTNVHEYWTLYVASRFLTKPRYYWDRPSDQVSLRSEIDVIARVLKRNMLTTADARRTTDKRRSQQLIML